MSRTVKLRDIVVLGLLSENPRYGYEIKMIIDNVMSHVIDISSGSLYYGLKKLQERGLVEESSVEKIGKRPERSIYTITAEGQEYLDAELPRVIFPRAQPYFPLDLALYFFPFIPEKEQARRLKMRLEYIKQVQKFFLKSQQELEQIVPANQMFILKHRLQFIAMERKFIQEVSEKLVDASSYTLTTADQKEITRELNSFKRNLKLETVHPEAADILATTS
jgi:DNA-binding PadR family transcriptional regulator